MFKSMGEFYGVDYYLKAMGWTHEEYLFTIKWTEDLVRGYYKDEEVPLLW